jgi:hypothetical protein
MLRSPQLARLAAWLRHHTNNIKCQVRAQHRELATFCNGASDKHAPHASAELITALDVATVVLSTHKLVGLKKTQVRHSPRR